MFEAVEHGASERLTRASPILKRWGAQAEVVLMRSHATNAGTKRRSGARRLVVAGLSLALVIALGAVAVLTSSAASREASAVHTRDRFQAQGILAGLTAEYLKFTALELSQLANSGHWSLRPGDVRDGRRLRAFIRTSPMLGQGAAIVSLSQRPLNAVALPPGLPTPTDPGYLPLISSLRAGTFGVSNVMQVGGMPVVAVGVPIFAGGLPRAVLIGYANARQWPLEGYTRNQLSFGRTATAVIVDGNGVAVAAGIPSQIGKPLPAALRTAIGGSGGVVPYSQNGERYIASYNPTGVAGWTTMTTQRASAFSGALDRSGTNMGLAVIALLGAAVGTLVLLAFKRNQALRQLADEALYDPLTGVQSRRLFCVRLDTALARQRRTGANFAVLFCDLDGFKAINDRHGHNVGDVALREIAQRLLPSVRPEDSVARFGGDEFVLLLEDVGEVDQVARVAESIERAVGAPVLLADTALEVGVSVGGVIHPPGRRSSIEEVMHAADLAMYHAKATGRVQISVLDESSAPGQGAHGGNGLAGLESAAPEG